jgi:hypothetical protein
VLVAQAIRDCIGALSRLGHSRILRDILAPVLLAFASWGVSRYTALGARIDSHAVGLSCGIIGSLLSYSATRVLYSWKGSRIVGAAGHEYHRLGCAVRDQVMLFHSSFATSPAGALRGLPNAELLNTNQQSMDNIASIVCRLFDLLVGARCTVRIFLLNSSQRASRTSSVVPIASTDAWFLTQIPEDDPFYPFSREKNRPFWDSMRTNENDVRCFRTGDSQREQGHCSIPGYGRSAISVLLCPVMIRPEGGVVGFLWISAQRRNVFDSRHERYAAGVAAQLFACCSPILASKIKLFSERPRQQGGWES